MNRRRIELKTISCKGVQSLALLQKPSLYVAVSLASSSAGRRLQRQKTPVDKDGGANPEWDFPMSFDLDAGGGGDLFLEFELKAHGGLLPLNRLVGRVVVPVGELAAEAPQVGPAAFRFVSYQVRAPDGKPNGALTFAYKLTDLDLPRLLPPDPAGPSPAPYYPPLATETAAYYAPPGTAPPSCPPWSPPEPLPSLYPSLSPESIAPIYSPKLEIHTAYPPPPPPPPFMEPTFGYPPPPGKAAPSYPPLSPPDPLPSRYPSLSLGLEIKTAYPPPPPPRSIIDPTFTLGYPPPGTNPAYLPQPPTPSFVEPTFGYRTPPPYFTRGGYYSNYQPPPSWEYVGFYSPQDQSYGHRMDSHDRGLYRL